MLEKLRKFLNNYGQIRIIEAIVDPEVQIEYLEYASKVRKDINREKIIEDSDKIFDENFNFEEKKKLLTLMAIIDDVEIYRKLEKYIELASPEIKSWAILAHQESQTVIQSSLLDENQILISTGLGGKGNKMRFFIVLQTESKINISEQHQGIIHKEILYSFEKYDCELEQINFKNYFCTLVALIPFDLEIEKVFMDIIKESNEMGVNFSDKFIVTNVKIHTPEQTQELITELEEKAKQDEEANFDDENLIFGDDNLPDNIFDDFDEENEEFDDIDEDEFSVDDIDDLFDDEDFDDDENEDFDDDDF